MFVGRWVLSVWPSEELVGPPRAGPGRGTFVTWPETEGIGMSPSIAGGALTVRVIPMLSGPHPHLFLTILTDIMCLLDL